VAEEPAASETVEERLSLLLESGQLSARAARVTRRLVDMIARRKGTPLAGEVAIMFVTHVALALERIAQGRGQDAGLPPRLLDEVKGRSKDWNFAVRLARVAEQELGAEFPDGEIGYIAAHLGALSLAEEA
jgi:transcriptional regulatory protein LevR